MGIAGSLDDVPLEDLHQRFVTVPKVQSRLATAHAKLITHVLGLLSHTLGEHRQSTQPETPQSLLRPIKLWYILPALLHSRDGRMKRRERFASAECGSDLTLSLPWFMEYTRRTSTRQSGQAREETDADTFKTASSACRHRGGVTVAACSLLAEPRATGNEETWERVKAKFPEEDQTCVSEAAAAAVAASTSDLEEGSGPNCPPEEEFDPQVALEVINYRNALSGVGSDGLRCAHFQSMVRTGFGRENSGAGIEAVWRRFIDGPNAFPPEFWQLFLQSNLTALGEKSLLVCLRMTWRRLIAAGTMRQWRPRLEEVYREARQFGVGVQGGVEQVALRARVHHEEKNWLILTDCSNAFNTSEADCYACGGSHLRAGAYNVRGKMLRRDVCAGVLSDRIERKAGDQLLQWGATRRCHGAGVVLHAAPAGAEQARAKFEPRGVEASAYLHDISIGMMEITPGTVEDAFFLQRELPKICIAINPSKTVALPKKGHVPTPEQIALFEGNGVSIAERGGVKVVGVPVGTDEYARESAMEIVRNGGAEQLARMLSRMPDKQ